MYVSAYNCKGGNIMYAHTFNFIQKYFVISVIHVTYTHSHANIPGHACCAYLSIT